MKKILLTLSLLTAAVPLVSHSASSMKSFSEMMFNNDDIVSPTIRARAGTYKAFIAHTMTEADFNPALGHDVKHWAKKAIKFYSRLEDPAYVGMRTPSTPTKGKFFGKLPFSELLENWAGLLGKQLEIKQNVAAINNQLVAHDTRTGIVSKEEADSTENLTALDTQEKSLGILLGLQGQDHTRSLEARAADWGSDAKKMAQLAQLQGVLKLTDLTDTSIAAAKDRVRAESETRGRVRTTLETLRNELEDLAKRKIALEKAKDDAMKVARKEYPQLTAAEAETKKKISRIRGREEEGTRSAEIDAGEAYRHAYSLLETDGFAAALEAANKLRALVPVVSPSGK